MRKKGHWKSAEVLHNFMENPDCAGSMSVLPESGRSEAAESGITRMSACIECEEQDLEKPDPGAGFFSKDRLEAKLLRMEKSGIPAKAYDV